jgi:hypothetical protein
MAQYIRFTFKLAIISFFIFIILVLQPISMISAMNQSQSNWIWTEIKSTYPEVYERISEDGQKISLVCKMDYRRLIFGFPFPVYKYEGSSSCGNTYVSLPGLFLNIISIGVLFWFIIRLLKKF